MERFLEKVAAWLERIRRAPVIGNLVEDLITMTELVSDCFKGIYENLPRGTVIGILAALFYAFSPIDLILDIIPFAGFLDDAAVVGLILELGLARDLMQYRDWKRQRRNEEIERYRETLVQDYLEQLDGSELAAAYLTEDLHIKLLLAKPGDTARPLPCKTKRVPIDQTRIAELELSEWEQIGEFYAQVFRDTRFPWTRFGRQPFRPEYAVEIDEAFEIVD
ncbi:MAG: DUF1232 domain-containing protein [Ruminococcaceae bacterium]|nr:DUF1232 domain-containing protein [Oscillospiraceae bacterium]